MSSCKPRRLPPPAAPRPAMRLFPAACILALACTLPAQADIFNLDDNPATPVPAPQPETNRQPATPPAPKNETAKAPPAVSNDASDKRVFQPETSAAETPFPSAENADADMDAQGQPAVRGASRPSPLPMGIAASIVTFLAAFVMIHYGRRPAVAWIRRQEDRFDRVLRQDLLMAIKPRTALALTLSGAALAAMLAGANFGVLGAVVAGATAMLAPGWCMKYLIKKRLTQLNIQLPDGLTSLSSGVRAGLNLVQAMQLLVKNSRGPMQQEFGQILREYEMGMDLNQAMRNAANRIGSPLYRLTFTAIEMHRIRGGDSGESMDRICEAVREIQRLEGKLDAVTSQSRAQATMLTFMPVAILVILMLIAPAQTNLLFDSGPGKLTLVGVAGAVLVARWWIHKIMQIDI